MTNQATTADHPAEQHSTVSGIFDELVKLRQGDGLTYEKIRSSRHARCIKRLPAIDDEMRRARDPDRALAAFSVIKCATLREIRNPVFSQILIRTLDLDGCGGNLTERRDSVAAVLGIHGENNYLAREKTAFLELSAILATAQESPCRGGGSVMAAEVLAQALQSTIDDQSVTIEIPMQSLLRQLIDALVSATRPGQPEETARAILDLLPRLRPHVEQFESDYRALHHTLTAVIEYYGDAFQRALFPLSAAQRRALLEVPPKSPLNFDLEVARMDSEHTFEVIHRKLTFWQRRRGLPKAVFLDTRRIQRPHFDRTVRLSVSSHYWQAKAHYLATLAATVGQAENNDEWANVFGTTQTVHADVDK